MSSPRLCASSSRPKSSRPSTIRDSGSARSSPRTGSASSSARSPSEHPSCGERSVRSCACWAPPTRSPTTSTSCVVARATSTASSQDASARATLPRARWCISSRRSPTSYGSRARATSNATAEGRSLVRVEAAAGLAAVMTGAVALLDAARWPVLLAPRGLIDRRTDHEREVDAGEIHETERSERMAERLLRGQVDLLEGGVALVDEESRLAAEGTEQPIRDEPLDLLLHQDRPLPDALRELDQQRRSFVRGVRTLHDLDDLHHHRRVEVMEVRDLRGTPRRVREQARNEGRGVSHEDRARRAEPIELGEDPAFHGQVLDDRLDGQVGVRRSPLPTMLFGRSERNSISAGILKRASDDAQRARSSSGVAEKPGRSTTNALTTSPRSGWGTPIAAASSTAGCA